ncbi:MAG: energy-coupling factor ABC transporter ATP-binding protein [Desulfovibrio sp.]|nr:energy-coupling factor ABC transporter ATP-binding protein [Desulfovibrio sp.]
MPDAAPLLDIRGLSFAYAGGGAARPALHDVSLTLKPGQRLGLYGPNGSGKTTLFRCITGLETPQKGEIFLHGAPMRTEKDFRVLRRAVGYVLQNADDQLFFPTVLEDVAFGPLNLGLAPGEARARAEETLASLGLADHADRLAHRLSGGEKTLVALATVLAMRPEALLLDEPTTGLDADARERIIEVLNGLTTARIVISHDWDFLERVAGEIWGMDKGRLQTGVPLEAHTHRHAHPLGAVPHAHGA